MQIEKGVPMPRQRAGGVSACGEFRAFLVKMDVGDSFESERIPVKLTTLRTMASHIGTVNGWKFTWRGSRVWRTA
jgi:hypothetical protein